MAPRKESPREKYDRVRNIDFEAIRSKNLEKLKLSFEYIKDGCSVRLIDKHGLKPEDVAELRVKDLKVEKNENKFSLTVSIRNNNQCYQIDNALANALNSALKFARNAAETAEKAEEELVFSQRLEFHWFRNLIADPFKEALELKKKVCTVFLLDTFTIRAPGKIYTGCCNLTHKNIIIDRTGETAVIKLDFIGKAGVHCFKTTENDSLFTEVIEELIEHARTNGSTNSKVLSTFDELTGYLKVLSKTLLPKDFRTYEASVAFENSLQNIQTDFLKTKIKPSEKIQQERMELEQQQNSLKEDKDELDFDKSDLDERMENAIKEHNVLLEEINDLMNQKKRLQGKYDEDSKNEREEIMKEKTEKTQELKEVKAEMKDMRQERKDLRKQLEDWKKKEKKLTDLRKKLNMEEDKNKVKKQSIIKKVINDAIKDLLEPVAQLLCHTTTKTTRTHYVDPRICVQFVKSQGISEEDAKRVFTGEYQSWACSEVYKMETPFKFVGACVDKNEESGDETDKKEQDAETNVLDFADSEDEEIESDDQINEEEKDDSDSGDDEYGK